MAQFGNPSMGGVQWNLDQYKVPVKPWNGGALTQLQLMTPEHFPALFEVQRRTGIIENRSFSDFSKMLKERSGFVVVKKGVGVIGCVTFSDYVPKHDVLIHCSILPEYHGRWATRNIYRRVFDYCFVELGVVRVSGYCIEGYTDKAGKFLQQLGFKQEGTLMMKALMTDGNRRNIKIFSLLVNERKWGGSKCLLQQ